MKIVRNLLKNKILLVRQVKNKKKLMEKIYFYKI